MAVKLLQVLVLVVGAAAHDVPVTWHPPKASLPCVIPGAEKLPPRHPPPVLDEDRSRSKLYVWERDGVELNRSSYDGSLDISRRKDPEGLYQCYTKYQGGRILGFPVNLKYAYIDKQFSVHPVNASAWLGQPFVLTCHIASGPPAAVSWLRNSKPLPADARYVHQDNQLLITEVRHEDAGLYRCKATNPLISKTRSSHGGRLLVGESPSDLEVAFLPILQGTTLRVPKGGTLVLTCPILGDQKTGVVWTLTPPGLRTWELESEEHVFSVSDIQLEQAGRYACRVKGYEHLNKTFEVTVTEPAAIRHPPESRRVVLASTVRFNCSFNGLPAPDVAWFKDGKELKLTQRSSIIPAANDKSLLQLLIRGVVNEDAGVYQCFARNSVGAASAWGLLSVSGPQTPGPENVRCWPVGASDVLLAWTDLNQTIIAYTIHISLKPEGTSLPEQPVTENRTTVSVKSPLTAYGFQVRAFYNSGSGKKSAASDYSETITCQGQGVPIKLSKLEDDMGILVSWQDFFERNPGVVQWILQYRLENGTEEQNVTLDGKIYNYTLKVSALDAVQVRVLGTRATPWLPQDLTLVRWTSSLHAAHLLGPGEMVPTPVNVEVTDVNPQNFSVHWQCEQDKRYNYLVCVRKLGTNINVCSDSSTTSMRVTHLDADTSYEVTVQAKIIGKAIGGDFSSAVIARTLPEDDVTFEYTAAGVAVRWAGAGARSVRYTQNITRPMELWHELNTTTQTSVEITNLDRTLSTYVMVASPGPDQRFTVHTIKPPPESYAVSSDISLYIFIIIGVLLVCVLAAAGVCIWHKRKNRSRSRAMSPTEEDESSPKQKIVGGRLANGAGPRDAGEPLLNGHVHITENPSQSKTPNGKIRKGHRYEAPFDVARYDGDVTLETVLDETNSTTLNLFDTSRHPEFDSVSPNASFNKLPDDNMNSEITRSTFELDTSKVHPTLQPNG